MIYRSLFLIVFVIFLPACTIVDGEYVQSTGVKIDYRKADELKNGVSTISDAIAALGEPSRRYVQNGEVEVLEYTSVKKGRSYEKTFGITHDTQTLSLRETLTLVFKKGLLSTKEEKEAVDREKKPHCREKRMLSKEFIQKACSDVEIFR